MNTKTITALAAQLRAEAMSPVATGETWAPADILPSDADVFAEELGRAPTAAEIAVFWEVYSTAPDLHDEIAAAVSARAQADTARALGLTRRAYHEGLGRDLVPSRGLLRAILERGCRVSLEIIDGEIVTDIGDAPYRPPAGFVAAEHPTMGWLELPGHYDVHDVTTNDLAHDPALRRLTFDEVADLTQ